MKKRVLVSGGAGYIGSHVTVELIQAGFDVVVADMDGVYGPLLRTAMDCAGRIVVVSDGSDGVNRRLEKVVKAFSVMDDNEDLRLLQRTRILYNRFGSRYQQRAEITGGVILILIGLKILLEHLGVL